MTILELERQRRRRCLTQADVAQHLRLTQAAVSSWERQLTSPSLWVLKSLAEWWKVEPATLLRKVRVQ